MTLDLNRSRAFYQFIKDVLRMDQKGVQPMNEKQVQIIEVAIQLFAKKGYHLTSIQEIADAAGIAKGSMYLYFKSKEDLLLSIYKYYYELFFLQQSHLEEATHLTPKERLKADLVVQFESVVQYRSFIKMQMKEPSLPLNNDIKQFLFNIRARTFQWYYDHLVNVYGKAFEPYALDSSVIVNGIIKEYMGYIILDNKELDIERLTAFIIDRLDDMVTGIIASKPTPVLEEHMMKEFLTYAEGAMEGSPKMRLLEVLAGLQQMIVHSSLEDKPKLQALNALTVMNEELEKTEPRAVVLQGMCSYLQNAGIAEAEKKLNTINELIQKLDQE